MELTSEEIEDIRRNELAALQHEAEARGLGAATLASTPRMEDKAAEHLARQREIRDLKLKVKEDFWIANGYQRYVTRHGKELWLTPEELKERKKRRRRHRRSQKGNMQDVTSIQLRARIQRVLFYLAVLGFGVFLGLQLV